MFKPRAVRLGWMIAAAMCLAGVAPAHANNTQTINTSDAYVDLSIAAAFTTVPTLCAEAIGDQNQTGIGCNALGAAAVEAVNGSGLSPDQYWDATQQNFSTNAFVPNNVGAQFAASGYAPLFSQHNYNLFGRGDEFMGPLTREEHLFFTAFTGHSATPGANPQTEPGVDSLWNAAIEFLKMPNGTPTVTVGGITFQIANMKFYTDMTGFNSGASGSVNVWCVGYFDSILSPGAGAIVCPLLSADTKANLYLENNASAYRPHMCAAAGSNVLNSFNCDARDAWMDQVVVGYIEAWASLGGSQNFAENFRSQVNYSGTALNALTEVITDFRLEQTDALGGTAFNGSRQTFQQAMATISTSGLGTTQGNNWGQLVTQDVEGWLYSCLNCDSETNNVTHAFTPIDMGMSFMPYTNTWRDLPSISHGASGGNLSTYAQAPGAPGP
ncbi:MAG: hypothetical protein HZA24_12040 [Nitrospirae bacterium]|nr:hypothetical protein [Nitrospirota bacterium]